MRILYIAVFFTGIRKTSLPVLPYKNGNSQMKRGKNAELSQTYYDEIDKNYLDGYSGWR